jgi:hypothetical protein
MLLSMEEIKSFIVALRRSSLGRKDSGVLISEDSNLTIAKIDSVT